MNNIKKTLRGGFRNFVKVIKIKDKNYFFLNWPYFIVYYFVIRQIVGLQFGLIYFFVFFLLLASVRFITISLIFFIISIIIYILGQNQEALNYMSFVFGFLFIAVVMEINKIFFEKRDSK